ncbi:MAG: hypothetical protein UW41_C0012G0013 [Candidatus Collierbacteria bacterium GW2011_GWC2_44_18]|uniref:Uncharacterized protein n=1 Tax=Candidatus Collierbacteria bacterium GW2011_GWC2_44_18 TaxID=1618392 RepID=A0A0G1HQ63_9BACT|nr:MAG: hypothetical protein UW16_C0031G0021 [Microgenomates group bacterium GW2011_GWC1_44_10]KKT49075.1 MAG: hypothetical protein UW41_C0012G0013 [Candidatus Collierbacteria bacterium GW2011_GWC2_44_18]
MNCPDCDSPELKINFKNGVADCPVCKYHANIGVLGEALGLLKDADGKSWNFSIQNGRSNLISVGGHTVGKVCFAEDSSIRLDIFESDVAWRLVIFFKEVFGEKTHIKVHTTCADLDLSCPVCTHSNDYFLRERDGRVVCGHCNSFSTELHGYLVSCLRNAGYFVPAQPASAFTIFTKKWIFDPVPLARFEDREGQFTLRPVDNRTLVFVALQRLIDSLKLSENVIVLNRI